MASTRDRDAGVVIRTLAPLSTRRSRTGSGPTSANKGPDDSAELQPAKDGNIGFRDTRHESEDAVALLNAENGKDVGKLTGSKWQAGRRCKSRSHRSSLPNRVPPIFEGRSGMTVNGQIGLVDVCRAAHSQFCFQWLPIKIRAGITVVIEIRPDLHFIGSGFVNLRKVHSTHLHKCKLVKKTLLSEGAVDD